MSIQTEIDRIKAGVSSAYAAVESKNGTLPEQQSVGGLAGAIESIPPSIPPGGAAGQVLVKKTDGNYDTEWEDPIAQKLQTARTINGAAFDGTKSINTSYAYNLELPMKTQEQWSIFAKIPDGGQYAFSCLIAAAGNYDYKVEGLYLLEFGKRYTNDIDAKVTCISEEGVWNIQPTLDKFGYFVQDGVTYVGIYNARYRGQTSITVLSTANAYNFRTQFGIFDEYTERPEGWTEIPIQKLTTKEYVDSLAWVPPNAASHNANPRCKYLGDHVTDEQYAAIATGTFDDMFVGDYWTINGFDWMCSGADYLFNTGDTRFTKHHWLITPRTNLYTAPMNDTNTTVGGYVNSKMYTEGLERAKEIIHAAFPGHVLKHRVYLTNAVTNGYPSGGMWRDSEVELMNEQMVYGSGIFSPASDGTNILDNEWVERSQLPLFAYRPDLISNGMSYWLRNIVSASRFSALYSVGISGNGFASNSLGVRPYFCIG